MKQLENQIAVVTGAGRGIGRAIALKLAAHGADIVAVDLKTEFVQETVAETQTRAQSLGGWPPMCPKPPASRPPSSRF